MSVARILADPDYAELKRWVLEHTGLSYYEDKDEDFAARVSRRMMAGAAPGCCAYLRLLLHEGGELDALIGELTIGETYFFRQREHFELLRTAILPDLLQRKQTERSISIWSAGCATGAEPYSISMLLAVEFHDRLADWDVTILGTDINTDFLSRARQASFGKWALRDVAPDLQAQCFEPDGKQWRLRPEYRRGVRFEYHNLAADAPLRGETDGPFDVIFCRNVMIYFSPGRIQRLAERLYDSLRDGGWLLVGHAESNPEFFHRYSVVCNDAGTAYRKSSSPPARDCTSPPVPSVEIPVHVPAPASISSRVAAPPAEAFLPTLEDVRVLADRGHWDEAEENCRRLLGRQPLNAGAHLTLGLILEHRGDRPQAEASFRRAIYLQRNFVVAHYHLGVSLQASGDTKQARKSFQNVLDLLRGTSGEEAVSHGGGMTAAELAELADMHLRLLA
jgi:chemotaxis protein methyltransferase CheR